MRLKPGAMADGDPGNPVRAAARHVPCPTCRRPALFAEANPWRPFCSQRCRTADLGAWASEQFRVAAPTSAESPDDDPVALPPASGPH